MKWEALRTGQRQAIDVAIDRYRADEPYTALVLPTRYGKSDTMRVLAMRLWLDLGMPCALALSPNVVLRDQLGDARRWNEALARYEIDRQGLGPIRTLDSPEARPNVNGEMFLSATVQLVERNIDVFKEWVESELHRTGRRPVVMIDECHTGSEDNNWGGVGETLVVAGARVVLFTATAVRSDGKRIPGFRFETHDEEPVKVVVTRPGSEPNLVRVELYEGIKRLLRLVADHTTPFADAWEENALCKVGRVPFDVDLSLIEENTVTPGLALSGLDSTAATRRALSRAVRSRHVIQEGARRMVRELRRFKAVRNGAAAIVFCGNDDDGERSVNKHANEIKREIEALAPEMRVVIATSAEAGKERLEAFSDGVGDVLIVKQMASLGLDTPRLKVGLDLSPVRTPAAYIQRMMRIATPCDGILHCVWIGPDDIISRALFEELVANGGGGATSSDLELVKAYEVERKDDRPSGLFSIDGTDGADFEDSQQHRGAKDQMPVVEAILSAFPAIIHVYSHAEIAEGAYMFGIVPGTPSAAEHMIDDLGPRIVALRADINGLGDEITSVRVQISGYDPDEWRAVRSDVFVRAYREAGVPRGVELKDVKDIAVLEAVRAAMQRILRDVLAVS